MEFRDKELEASFQNFYRLRILGNCRIFLVQTILTTILQVIFYSLKYYQKDSLTTQLKPILLILLFVRVVPFIHYFAAKRFPFFAFNFGGI